MQEQKEIYFDLWRKDLSLILSKFEGWRHSTRFYFLKVFVFFVIINDLSYWFAMYTAFPELMAGDQADHYFGVQFPVALLGGMFDSLSLYITLIVVRRALVSNSNVSYVLHLSIDILIAIVATFWVLFVFSTSGWVVSLVMNYFDPVVEAESLIARNQVYTERVVSAIEHPTGESELKNIYFGLVMGISAIIPTAIHLLCSFLSLRVFLKGDFSKDDRT